LLWVPVAVPTLVLVLELPAQLLRCRRRGGGDRELERLALVAELVRRPQLGTGVAELPAGLAGELLDDTGDGLLGQPPAGHRHRAAASVARRPGGGARRARPDPERSARVTPRDRSPAGTHRVHGEHRQRDRPPGDLAGAVLADPTVVDHTHVARGAAHVEAQ